MQWDASPHAGFVEVSGGRPTVEPWLPVASDYPLVNVAAERADPRSELACVRELLALRRSSPALTLGSYRELETPYNDVLAYLRESPDGGQRMLVALNLGPAQRMLDFSALAASGILRCSTCMDRSGSAPEPLAELALRSAEGVVIELATEG